MKYLLRIVLAALAGGAGWAWWKSRAHSSDGRGWRLPAFSAGASAHVDAATASWRLEFGHREPDRIGVTTKPVKVTARAASSAAALAAPTPDAAFYVYSDGHSRARIHQADCRYCNDGAGTRPDQPNSSDWRGPFASFAEAETAATTLELRDTAPCAVCCAGAADD